MAREYSRLTVALWVVVVGLAAAIWFYWPASTMPVPSGLPDNPPQAKLPLRKVTIAEADVAAQITHVQIVDFDGDGRNDIAACDAARHAVFVYRQTPKGGWEETVLAEELQAPAHATFVDLDRDGDQDVLVSVMGSLDPSDELIGKVVLLENDSGIYRKRVLLDDVRRVTDIQPADFDGDGDTDLAVAVFGYLRGEVLWLENRGGGRFRDHQLLYRPGTIHVPVGDLDGDGDPDIAAVVTQNEEELWGFENLGGGKFRRRRLYYTNNYDVGGAGLVMSDLDRDGDLDLVLPQGDNLEDIFSWPQTYHGCLWFENRGDWEFHGKSIGTLGLTYAAAVGDLDGDGHRDVVLAALTDQYKQPPPPSLVWLRNDGQQNFTPWQIDDAPNRLVTVACGDLNGDGRADIVACPLLLPIANRATTRRITAWISEGPSE